MSFEEQDAARDEYESQIANEALKDGALEYALQNEFGEVRHAVEETQAQEWLEKSSDWLQLVSIVSQHDREQLRGAVRTRAYEKRPNIATDKELPLFNLASDVSKVLESLSAKYPPPPQDCHEIQGLTEWSRYGYRPGPTASELSLYSRHCTLDGAIDWAADLIALARAFREILFLVADADKNSLEWELAKHLKVLDKALATGAQANLIYRGREGKHHRFDREPNPETTPLSAIMANWMADYLSVYSDIIDLGVCIECGKIFSRQRSDNSYCSRTCQNRLAYKRRKIFEGGLLQKIELTPTTIRERLQPGDWAYHSRLSLGVVEAVEGTYGPSVTVRFPQTARTFHGRDLFKNGTDAAKVEFYNETDSAALAELL